MEPLLRRTLGEQVDLRFVHDAAPRAAALIDPGQLGDAVLNLCLNARDAMPGGGRITVEVRDVELDEGYVADYPYVVPGPYVLVAVSDDGTGIAPEHLGRVFEPFFTTKDKDKGTGLGLSMVYGFIKQSGGYIQVYSEPGQGTSVKMYLPCAAQAGATAAAAPVAAERCGGNETILLVEDDDLVRRYAREQLLALGYRVFEAASGAEALALAARTGAIDLLLTDMVRCRGV